jgi:uncharacterized membrane protein
MIQRIQSIYLVLAFTCVVLAIFFPLFSIEIATDTVKYTADFGAQGLIAEGTVGEKLETTQMPLYAVFIGLGLITLAALFLYKNRKRQVWVVRISLILHLLVSVGIYSFYYIGRSFIAGSIELPEGETATVKLSTMAGFYFLLATLPLLLLAIRGIKSDEKLVKSLDRLR